MISADEIIRLYVEQKMSTDKISRKFGIPQTRVLNLLKSLNIEIRGNVKIDSSEYDEIVRLFKEEYLSGQMIADKYNVNRATIFKILNKLGVDTSKAANGKVLTRCIICNRKIERQRKRFRENHNNFCCHEHYLQWIQENKTENYNEHRQGQRNARKVMEKYYGELPFGSIVHHVDGDCDNNVITNLILFPAHSEHMKFHRGDKDKCIILFDGRNCHESTEE